MDQLKIKMRQPHGKKLLQSLASDWQIYVLLLPVVIWFALWAYKPMGGLLIAFKRFDSSLGVWNSDFKGIANFMTLVSGVYQTQFWQAFRNTFVINAYSLVFGFPVPIILAILFAEIGNSFVRKLTQTATYLPHFLSEVTITSITIMLAFWRHCSRGWTSLNRAFRCFPTRTISVHCTLLLESGKRAATARLCILPPSWVFRPHCMKL